MGTECQKDYSDEDQQLLDEAENATWGLPTGIIEAEMPAIQPVKEDYQRALESVGRDDMAHERAERETKDPAYQERVSRWVELKTGEDRSVTIRGFDASKRSNEEALRIQQSLPAIINQITKEVRYTDQLKDGAMTPSGEMEYTLEHWDVVIDKAAVFVHKHEAEMFFGKNEENLTPRQQEKLKGEESHSQYHGNFHTVWEMGIATQEDKDAWTEICIAERMAGKEEVTEYAEQKVSEDARFDEAFCEAGAKFMLSPDELKDHSKEKYEFIREKMEHMEKFSKFLGI